LQQGVLLADEVGLGQTIEAALVVCQYWAERRRRLLVICPASLRKQWAQELHDKFAVPGHRGGCRFLRKQSAGDMLATLQRLVGKAVVIMSYQFAAKLEAELRATPWDLVVIDEAHKLRNAHRASNRTGQALKRAFARPQEAAAHRHAAAELLMELYGLSTLIDEHLFGDEAAFRKQFMNSGHGRIGRTACAPCSLCQAHAAPRRAGVHQVHRTQGADPAVQSHRRRAGALRAHLGLSAKGRLLRPAANSSAISRP
jgi:hypothetical protein